jgi:glycosyltransferase involved in cell wall biosynthesis
VLAGGRLDSANVRSAMAIALITNYLPDYRLPLYELLAQRYELEVLCYGGAGRYVPGWFKGLDRQLAAARFPARRINGAPGAFAAARGCEAVIVPFAGGAVLPAAYAGARSRARKFILWASVWAQPRSSAHALALPVSRHLYRNANAVIAYGEHVRRFVARIRGHDSDVFVAPQAVEAELFGRRVTAAETESFRHRHGLGDGPLVIYCGRFVEAKGIAVLSAAWRASRAPATLIAVGEGPMAAQLRAVPGVRVIGPLPRLELPVAYAACELAVVPSIDTPRFREPWGLVCNEAMHQGLPVLASTAVGAVAGGLVRDGETGLVVRASDVDALAAGLDRLLADPRLRARLGGAGQRAVAAYTYEAMAGGFEQAITAAGVSH